MSDVKDTPKPTRIEPPITETTEAFWDATREKRFLVQWCATCGDAIFYPREVCPACLSADGLEWRESDGNGTVYAVSVQHRPGNPFMKDRVPYAVALVEVETGGSSIRMMTNVVGCPAEEVSVGMPVQVTWEPLSDGRNLPLFEPRNRTHRSDG